jgi:FtsP/CotA-like multicopper oxidase with cupredoxin domain
MGSMGDMGMAGAGTGATSVTDLVTETDREADVTVDLVARASTITLASGRKVEGYTLNDSSPGPLIEVTQGDLVEVHLRNESVPDGITLHWHCRTGRTGSPASPRTPSTRARTTPTASWPARSGPTGTTRTRSPTCR